jgi:crotonobetainyl-CoA:carnitine CoA-transferase CaiB-like acyl-CoA transferase
MSPEDVSNRAQAVQVACFPVSTPSELLQNAQLRHRELFDRLISPRGAQASVPGLPFRIETTGHGAMPRARERRSPTLDGAAA